MSKLFDRLDHLWELDQIDRAEMAASGDMTGFEMARLDGVGRSDKLRLLRSKTGPAVGQFEKLRTRSRMKLLKTGQLMADLGIAMGLFRACPHCKEVDGRSRACDAHRDIVRAAILAVKYAGEDNMATRLAQPGRIWGEDEPLLAPERGLNEWEQWYYKDRKEGIWPGDAQWAKREFGDLGYRGWLQMLFENEEIPYPEFIREKARLNAANVG